MYLPTSGDLPTICEWFKMVITRGYIYIYTFSVCLHHFTLVCYTHGYTERTVYIPHYHTTLCLNTVEEQSLEQNKFNLSIQAKMKSQFRTGKIKGKQSRMNDFPWLVQYKYLLLSVYKNYRIRSQFWLSILSLCAWFITYCVCRYRWVEIWSVVFVACFHHLGKFGTVKFLQERLYAVSCLAVLKTWATSR